MCEIAAVKRRPLNDALDGLRSWRIGPVRNWLEGGFAGSTTVGPKDLSQLEAAVWWADERSENEVTTAARPILEAASRDTRLLAMTLLYFRLIAAMAWEEAWDVDGGEELIRASRTFVDARGSSLQDQDTIDVCARWLELLGDEFLVEAHSCVGSLSEWSDAAAQLSQRATQLARETDRIAIADLRDFLLAEAEAEVRYYAATSRAAAAAMAISAGRVQELGGAIDQLRIAEEGADPQDASELRAHRLSLTALASAADRPWLRIDRARVTFIYPFGLTGGTSATHVGITRQHAHGWHLGGQPVVDVRANLPLSDLWKTKDPLGRGYRGSALRLPEVQLVAPDGTVEHELAVEIWLSEMGNHLLRFDFTIEDCDPFALHDVLKAASPEFGDLTRGHRALVSILTNQQGDPLARWCSPVDLADALLTDLGASLRRCGDPDAGVSFAPTTLTAYTVIDAASAWTPSTGVTERVDNGQDLRHLFGSQVLSQPLGIAVTSIAQWAQYDHQDLSIAIGATGPTWLRRTENSATLASFGAPSYALDMISDCVVFEASLRGAFEAWNSELARFNDHVGTLLGEINARLAETGDNALTSAEIRTMEDALETRQLVLHDLIARCRSVIFFVSAPTLVTSPVMRVLLDDLLEAGDHQRQVASFNASAQALAAGKLESVFPKVRARVQEIEARELEIRERRVRLLTEALLAGVAVAGVSGLASLVQAGYALGPLPTIALVVSVVLLSCLIGVWIWRSSQQN